MCRTGRSQWHRGKSTLGIHELRRPLGGNPMTNRQQYTLFAAFVCVQILLEIVPQSVENATLHGMGQSLPAFDDETKPRTWLCAAVYLPPGHATRLCLPAAANETERITAKSMGFSAMGRKRESGSKRKSPMPAARLAWRWFYAKSKLTLPEQDSLSNSEWGRPVSLNVPAAPTRMRPAPRCLGC